MRKKIKIDSADQPAEFLVIFFKLIYDNISYNITQHLAMQKLRYYRFFLIIFSFGVLYHIISDIAMKSDLPQGFVYLQDVEPTILISPRYASSQNFIGKTV